MIEDQPSQNSAASSEPHEAKSLEADDNLAERSSDAIADWLAQHPRLIQVTVWTIVVGSIITGVVLFVTGQLDPEGVGYTGAFLINLVGSASVVVPVPGLAAVCAAAAPDVGLNLILLGLVGGAGSTIGELTGYLAGYGGQSFVQKSKYYGRIQRLVMRRGALALFVLAVLPTPIFDIAGIASGSLGYPLRRFLLWVFLGKIIKFIGIAYACQQGIDWLTNLFT